MSSRLAQIYLFVVNLPAKSTQLGDEIKADRRCDAGFYVCTADRVVIWIQHADDEVLDKYRQAHIVAVSPRDTSHAALYPRCIGAYA